MSGEASCVFCKIIRGDIPATIVHRSEACLAFLDIQPLAAGHLLVVPTRHYETLDQLPVDLAAGVASELPRLAGALLRATGAAGYNVLVNNGSQAGQVVPHLHIHLIPRSAGDALGYRWSVRGYESGEAERLADAYRRALVGS